MRIFHVLKELKLYEEIKYIKEEVGKDNGGRRCKMKEAALN